MYPHSTQREFERDKVDGGAANRRRMHARVRAGVTPGILGFEGDRAIAWCAIEPRASIPRLGRSRILAPVDDREVWSIVCLFVERSRRRSGVSVRMIDAAARFVGERGGRTVEGYPVEPREDGKMPDAFVWTGTAAAFAGAGFREVARRSPTRPIMRRDLR